MHTEQLKILQLQNYKKEQKKIDAAAKKRENRTKASNDSNAYTGSFYNSLYYYSYSLHIFMFTGPQARAVYVAPEHDVHVAPVDDDAAATDPDVISYDGGNNGDGDDDTASEVSTVSTDSFTTDVSVMSSVPAGNVDVAVANVDVDGEVVIDGTAIVLYDAQFAAAQTLANAGKVDLPAGNVDVPAAPEWKEHTDENGGTDPFVSGGLYGIEKETPPNGPNVDLPAGSVDVPAAKVDLPARNVAGGGGDDRNYLSAVLSNQSTATDVDAEFDHLGARISGETVQIVPQFNPDGTRDFNENEHKQIWDLFGPATGNGLGFRMVEAALQGMWDHNLSAKLSVENLDEAQLVILKLAIDAYRVEYCAGTNRDFQTSGKPSAMSQVLFYQHKINTRESELHDLETKYLEMKEAIIKEDENDVKQVHYYSIQHLYEVLPDLKDAATNRMTRLTEDIEEFNEQWENAPGV